MADLERFTLSKLTWEGAKDKDGFFVFLENPLSHLGLVFRTFQTCAVAMARRLLGGTQVLQKRSGLPST